MKIQIFTLLSFLFFNLNAQDFNQIRTGEFIDQVVVADFDGDGDQDAFGVNYGFGSPSDSYLMTNNGTQPISFTFDLIQSGHDIKGQPATIDFDKDGDWDVLISKGDAQAIFLLENDGTGTFTEIDLGLSGVLDLHVADIENDGDLDIFGSSWDTDRVDVFFNDGAGNYTMVNVVSGSGDIEDFAVGDLDGDGDLDIAVVFDEFNGPNLTVYEKLFVDEFRDHVIEADEFRGTTLIKIADLDNNGTNELLSAAGSQLFAWENEGNFSYKKTGLGTSPGSPVGFREIEVIDITGNSIPEIVGGSQDSGIFWYRKSFAGDLSYTRYEVGGVTPALNFGQGDFDNDGDIDLFASNGDLWIYENIAGQIPASVTSSQSLKVAVSPNPFSDFIKLENITAEDQSCEILDISGKLIKSFRLKSDLIDLTELNAGIYFLKIQSLNSELNYHSKLIKMN